MNVDHFNSHLKFLAPNGVTLNINERMTMGLAIDQLQAQMNFEELNFWGKIEGCLTDYYIVVGINYLGHQQFCKKSFYWCTGENKKFSLLPDPLSQFCRPIFDQLQTVFTGEFDKVIVQASGVSDFVHFEKELLAQVKIPPRGITELDRLSHVVNQIDYDCQIVPMRAVKMIPLREIRKNEAFKGLTTKEAFSVENYVHFRLPSNKKNVDMNLRREGIYANDFLDNASQDTPKEHWSLLKDTMGSTAVLRSKLWPGYYAFHKSNSNIYGGFYVGTGCKNLDLPFMF